METIVYQEAPSGDFAFEVPGDAWAIDQNQLAFAVADAPPMRLVRRAKRFPFDDHAPEAAKIFCNSFVKFFSQGTVKASQRSIVDALNFANLQIKKYNISLGKNYQNPGLNYDFAGCVGSAAVIANNTLYYGLLEDCYVSVLRGKKLTRQILIEPEYLRSVDFLHKAAADPDFIKNLDLYYRQFLKTEDYWEVYRWTVQLNNPELKDEKGHKVGLGYFSGHQKAENFYQTGQLKLLKGDYVLLYTDGMIPVLDVFELKSWLVNNAEASFDFNFEFRQKIRQYFKGMPQENKERTLILIKNL